MDVLRAVETDFTNADGALDYSAIYACQDAAKLERVLSSILGSGILRGFAFQVLDNTLTTRPEVKDFIEVYAADLFGAEYVAYSTAYAANPAYYSSAYWTAETVSAWANAIALANKTLAELE